MTRLWKKALGVAAILGCVGGTVNAQQPRSVPDTIPAAPPTATTAAPAGSGSVVWADGPNPFANQDDGNAGGLIFGAGLHILRPYIPNNQGLFSANAGLNGNITSENFVYKLSASPSLWAGYVSDSGFGVKFTWFYFDQGATSLNETQLPLDPVTGKGRIFTSPSGFIGAGAVGGIAPGQTAVYNANSDLQIQQFDLDFSQRFCGAGFICNAGAGVRLMHIWQGYGAFVRKTGIPADAIAYAQEVDENSALGIGPTVFLDVQRPIGSSGLGVYSTLRGGILFGTQRERSTAGFVFNPGGGAATATGGPAPVSRTSDLSMGIGEIELGVCWTGQTGNVTPFARVGLEARDYLNVGNAQSIIGVIGQNNNLGLFGLVVRLGVGF